MRGLAIECRGERLTLDPERAVYWPARETLAVADVHLGKEFVFAREGLAVPAGSTATDLARLAGLVERYRARRLLVLGDLVHAVPRPEESWLAGLGAWLDARPALEVVVVAGNHDRPAARRRLDGRLDWRSAPLVEPPFVFLHEPEDRADGYGLGGHLHPTYRLAPGGADRLRAPAFWFRASHGVLPAFGSFTGGANVRAAAGDRIYLAGPEAVIAVPEPGG